MSHATLQFILALGAGFMPQIPGLPDSVKMILGAAGVVMLLFAMGTWLWQACRGAFPSAETLPNPSAEYVPLKDAAARLYAAARAHDNAGLAETMMEGDPGRIIQWYCRTVWRHCPLYGKHPPSPEREVVPRDLESFYTFRFRDGVLTLEQLSGKGGAYVDLEVLESELPPTFAEVEGSEGGAAWQHSSTRKPPASEAPQPISVVDLAAIADTKFGWDLLSGSHSGWQLWDFKSGLAHAANQGRVTFEGKRFAGFANPPPDSPFLRRDELYTEISRDEWQRLRLEICVPGMHFGAVSSNFEVTICSTLTDDSSRYWDVRLTDRSAAERWLEP